MCYVPVLTPKKMIDEMINRKALEIKSQSRRGDKLLKVR